MDTYTTTIAISGVGRGIGRAIALAFGQAGWTVFGAARNQEDLNRLHEQWQRDGNSAPLHTYVADLSTASGCTAWAEDIHALTDQLDALVHNVGQFGPGTLLDGPADQLDQFLRVNLLSAHYLSRALLPLLKARPVSYLLTIGSVATTDWPPPMSAYALSKYALEGWHKTIRKELADTSVRCTLVRPGATFTSSWDGIAVDPTTLLAPEQVAHLILRRLTDHAAEDIEDITIRP